MTASSRVVRLRSTTELPGGFESQRAKLGTLRSSLPVHLRADALRWTTFAWLANRSSRSRRQDVHGLPPVARSQSCPPSLDESLRAKVGTLRIDKRAKGGADDRDRTGDLVLTKDALCQLSYIGPRAWLATARSGRKSAEGGRQLSAPSPVRLRRLAASARQTSLAGLPRRSSLGEASERSLAGQEGLEPPALGFGDRCSTN